MKKIFYIVMIFLFASCTKALVEKSYDFLVPSSFYKTEADAESAIIGVYNTLLSYGFYRQSFWEYDLDCDHASGASWFLGAIGEGNYLAYWGTDNAWNDHYLMIARANSVLENVAPMDINPDVRQRVLGEAYFFRGLAYFDLVRFFGGVPLRLNTVSSGKEPTSMPRSTVMETYQQIIADFKKAAEMLFPYLDARSGGIGHVTKDVATAYLAKTYATIASGALSGITINVLTSQKKDGVITKPYGKYPFQKVVVTGLEGINSEEYYKLARDESAKVIANSGRTLFPGYMDNFKLANRHLNENMLMAEFDGPILPEDALVQVFSGEAFFGPGNGGGWAWGTKNFYNNYLKDGTKLDERALYGINHQPVINGKYYFPKEDSEYATNGYTWQETEDKAYTTKFDDISQKVLAGSDARYPIMRLADVYLLNAEANNELGNMNDAYTSLNTVRRRSKTLDAPTGMNKDDFRSFVIEERGREFFFENNRRFDLLRWGIYLGVMNFMNADQFGIVKVRGTRSLLLPIPQSEINSNTMLPVNNPGW